MNMLVARKVNVKRGDTHILHDVDLDAHRGELIGILGARESGKSTLLYALSGLVTTVQGSVSLDDVRMSEDLKQVRRRIGVVTQDDEVVTGALKVRRALEYTADLRMETHDAAYRAQQVERVLHAMKLGASAELRISRLTVEQRRRVVVAVELLTEPEVLCLDEPTRGLDLEAARALMHTLHQRCEEGGIVILTTRLLSSLEECDRVYVLEEGRVVYCGEVTALPDHMVPDP